MEPPITQLAKTRSSIPPETLDPSQFDYQLTGQNDSPLIVLIHGLKSARQTFFPIIEPLSKNYQVLVYDQRGHGKSPVAFLDYSLDSMATDLKNLLSFLKLDQKNFFLLGHSAGGRTSMRFCELFPEKIKGLIIEDMDFIPIKNNGLFSALKTAEKLKKLPEMFENLEKFNEKMKGIVSEWEIEEILQRRVLKNPNGSIFLLFKPWVACLYGHFYKNSNFIELCQKIQKPTLVLQAENMHSAISDKGAKHIENCKNKFVEMKRIVGATHNVHGSKTVEFLKVLELFLKKI